MVWSAWKRQDLGHSKSFPPNQGTPNILTIADEKNEKGVEGFALQQTRTPWSQRDLPQLTTTSSKLDRSKASKPNVPPLGPLGGLGTGDTDVHSWRTTQGHDEVGVLRGKGHRQGHASQRSEAACRPILKVL